MKLLAVIVLVAFVAATQAASDEEKKLFAERYQKCVGESGVDEALIKKVRAGEFTEDAKLKNYILCMYKQYNLLDGSGNIVAEEITKRITNDAERNEAVKAIENCKTKKGPDAATTAYETYKCFKQATANPIKFF